MATKSKLGIPGQRAGIIITDENPAAYVGDRYAAAGGVVLDEAPPADEGPGLMGRLGDAGLTLVKGAIGVPEAAVGLADIATGGRVGKFLENEGGAIGFRPEEAKKYLDEFYTPQQKAAFKAVQDASNPNAGLVENIGNVLGAAVRNPSTIAHAVGESLPLLGAGGVLGRGVMAALPMRAAASPWAGIAAAGIGEGTISAGAAAEQIRQQTTDGLLTGKQALIGAGIGAATGGIGMVAAKVARSLGIGDIDVLLAGGKNVDPGLQKGFVRRVLEGAFTEGVLEELPQSMQEQIGQNYALGKPLDEGLDTAMVMGTLAGGAMGGGVQMLMRKQPEVGPLSRAANKSAGALAYNPSAGTHTVFPDGTVVLNSDSPEGEEALLNKRYAAQPAINEAQGQLLLDHANKRTQELDARANGVKGVDGAADVPGVHLTPSEKQEQEFLKQAGGDVNALARAYPDLIAPPPAPPPAQTAPPPVEAPAPAPVTGGPSTPGTVNVDTPAAPVAENGDDDTDFDPNPVHQPGDILSPLGKPFEYRAQAGQRLNKEPDIKLFTIERVKGGFVVRPRPTGAPNAEPTEPADPAAPVVVGGPSAPGSADTVSGEPVGGPEAAGTGQGAPAGEPGDSGSGAPSETVGAPGSAADAKPVAIQRPGSATPGAVIGGAPVPGTPGNAPGYTAADILNALGKPFTNKRAAMNRQRELGNAYEVVPVDGGFVVRKIGAQANDDSSAHNQPDNDADIQQLAGDEEPLQQPEERKVPDVRRGGDQGVPGVGGELRRIPVGDGREADAEAHPGQDREQQGLPAGQRPLGDAEGAGSEQTGQPIGDGRVGGPDAGAVGGEVGDKQKDDLGQAGPGNAAGTGGESKANGGIQAEGADQGVDAPGEDANPVDVGKGTGDIGVGAGQSGEAGVGRRGGPDAPGGSVDGEESAPPVTGGPTEPKGPKEPKAPKPELTADTAAPAEAGKPTLDTPEGRQQVAQQVADRLIGGDGFATIVEARKFIGEIIGKKIEPATRDAKLADETVETGVVLAGREIVRAARKQGRSDEVIYDRLVGLYKAQPNLGVRSSTSVREQAYSTPMPLAFLASRLAGVTPTSRVGEPTAGNGALMIEVEPGNAVVNELNSDRAGNLRELGFDPTTNNAATSPLAPAQSLDAEVMNPPFGAVKDGNRESIRYQVLPNFDTIEVDHAIAFEALKALKDDGKAVLILGGVDKSDPEAIRDGYRGKGKREFYYHLYQNYKVVDHFTVDGDLYSRQGAAYPVDVVVIHGRGKATRTLPAAELPQRFDSWESLKEKLHGNDSVVSAGDRPGTDGGADTPRGSDGGAVVVGAGRPADGDGAEGAGPRGSDAIRGDGDGRGDTGQPAADRGDAGAAQPRTENGDDAGRVGRGVPGQGDGGQQDGIRGDGGNRPDGVAGSGRADGQQLKPGLTDRRGQEQETATQVAYQPKSTSGSVGTLVPINMRDPIQASLDRVESEVGNLDEYVGNRLGLKPDEVASYFSAEQVDALALAVYNAEHGKGFIIGDQCVAAGTRIYDPVTNEHTPIEELVRRGKPHHVLSLTKDGFQPFRAISFRKGVADLYRVTLDDGRAITVTRQHRFLTPLGWASLGDGIDAGSLVSIHEPGHTSALATRRADAPRDSKTPQDCLDDYFEGSRPCGGQPLAAAGGVQAPPPSPADALEHSPALSHAGGPGASPEHSPSSQMLDRLSRSSFSQAASRGHDETRAQERAFVEQLLPRPHQDDRQSGRSSESCCQAIGAVLADQQDSLEGDLSRSLADAGCLASQVGSTPWQPSRRIDSPSALRASRLDTAPQSHPIALVKSLPASSSLDDYTGWQRVSAVEFVRRDEYFDMHVPGPENYVAEGFVNHNTGIGKGRVVAGMIRYAITNDIVPIFVTEKPNLYSDMIRDLDAIGMADVLQLDSGKPAILMTNGGERIPYTLVRGKGDNVVEHEFDLKAPGSGKTLDKALADMVEADSLGPYKVVFTTYNQLQTVKGRMTERMNFARHFGDGGYVIFDESHNAGGTGPQRTKARNAEQRQAEGNADQTGRAAFVRGLVGKSAGSFFSSATYAKRPDVMDLYSSTNMMLAVDRPADLGPAIKAGGVPMQQSVATMLTEDGQYIRRERTFAGVTYETRTAKVDRQTAENMATAMRRVLAFSRAKEKAVKDMQKEADREGARMQVEGEKTQIQSANFGAIMHNLIDQMLLALKAKDSVDFAVDRLKAGEKVVLTVSNTMGSFLKEYADQMGLRTGEPVALTFKDLYQRYLEKQRWVKIKKPGGSTEEYRLTDEDLGEKVAKMFADIQTFLEGAGFGEAPISPIDYMHAELRKAGFKTDEITGRTVALNYETGTPKLATRKASIRQRLAAIRGFNNGEIDALILNQSGSTGLSLHASKDFKDQRPRRMIVVQAEKNIDTHMQILGRVHRTGQVVVPAYTQSAADIPAESRPAAVLLKKMVSLSANTTASRKSAVAAEGVVDFMNDYGAQVVHEYLMDNPDVHAAIGGNQVLKLVDDPSEADEADIRKFTGYIPILPIEQQEQVYADLIDRYNELIAREDSMGTNKLEARALDLDAKQLSSETVTPRKTGTSRFAEPANMERLDVKRTVKPMTGEEVRAAVTEGLDGKTADQQARELMNAAVEATDAYRAARLAQLRSHGADQPRLQREDDTIRLQLGQVRSMLQTYPPGTPVTITDKHGGITYGVVTSVADSRKTKNPAAGSSWKMTLALANGDARSITVNFGQIGSAIKLTVQRDEIPAVGVDGETEWVKIPDMFDRGATVRREKRWMVTGNILAGFAKYPGQIVSYTKNDGTIGQGVLMSRSFDFDKAKARAKAVFSTVEQVNDFFAEAPRGAAVGTEDTALRIVSDGYGSFDFITPSSKKDGGKFYLDSGLTDIVGDFFKSGQIMRARVRDHDDAMRGVRYLLDRDDVKLVALNQQVVANKVLGIGATDGKDPAASRGDGERAGRRADVVEAAAKSIAARWTGAPEIVVARSIADPLIPEAVRDNERAAVAAGARAGEGFFYDGKVYLLADNLGTDKDVARVLAHEIVGHYGMRGTFGADFGAMLDRMAVLNAGRVRSAAGKLKLDFDKKSERRMAAEEVLAYMAQSQPELGWVGRALAAIRTWARDNIPGFSKMGFSNGELIRDFILPARRWVEGGGPKGGKTVNVDTQDAPTPFSRGSLAASLLAGANNVRDAALPAGYVVSDLFNRDGKLSWWHKTVGTPYNLAQRSEPFKRVFDAVQNFLNDASYYSAEAAALAPAILPNLDKATDALPEMTLFGKKVGKSPLSPADTKGMSAPVFEGTLLWARDVDGTARRVEDMDKDVSLDDKAHQLLRGKFVTPEVLRMWQGMPIDQYEKIIEGKFERELRKPGVVFTDAELREHFGATDRQIDLYRQFRKAIDKSIDNLAVTEMLHYGGKDIASMRESVLGMDPDAAAEVLRDKLFELAKTGGTRREALDAAGNKMIDIADHATDMKKRGYAPLSRFGSYTLEATGADGEPFFSLYETARERAKAARELEADGATNIKTGTMSQEDHKLFSGITPETAALFGEMLGLDEQGDEAKDRAFAEYVKRGTSNRSAMKRLLKRKGIAGFSEDAGRVLASFIYSNGRKTSSNLHTAELDGAVNEIPKESGELKDAAIRLREYVRNPQEEAQAFRGLLFAQYLGGSIASAMVNATQPFAVTFPYLSQFGGATKSGARLAAALKMVGKDSTGNKDLDAALKKAEEEGIVSPQEIHSLQAQALGKAQLKSGDGTRLGDAWAKAGNMGAKLSLAWGKVFGVAEQFNRRLTFIAAYNTAVEEGIPFPAQFAEKAVNETQFVYNKGNKPRWARGAVGSILFTFKQFSVNYVELLVRMANAGEPGSPEREAGRRAALLALAVLFMMAGAEGLPFVEDIQDVIDGALQRMGYSFSSKQKVREFLTRQIGKGGAEIVTNGLSGIPGAPIDFSGRLSMGNLIPGTGGLQKKDDRTRDLMEIAGAGGDMVKRGLMATEQLLAGDVRRAATTIAPVAARNVVKALDMAATGMYRDDRGNKIVDTTIGEAIAKGGGFQPRTVDRVQEATFEAQRQRAQYALASREIREKWARAMFENNAELLADAKADLAAWNKRNPDAQIKDIMPVILSRVREMRKSKAQRIADTSPTAIRGRVRAELAEELK